MGVRYKGTDHLKTSFAIGLGKDGFPKIVWEGWLLAALFITIFALVIEMTMSITSTEELVWLDINLPEVVLWSKRLRWIDANDQSYSRKSRLSLKTDSYEMKHSSRT